MGKKYASIHIFGGEQDKILSVLKDFYNNDKSLEETIKKAISVFKNVEVQRMFERQAQLSLPDILIIKSERFISIYDENISFQTIEAKAKALSSIIDRPIIYTSNFDDDILIFGIYRSGILITSKKMGQGLLSYNIPSVNLEVDKFCSELVIEKADSMNCFNISENIFKIEEELENILQITLGLTFGDIEYDYEQFVEIFIENRVHVFEKV